MIVCILALSCGSIAVPDPALPCPRSAPCQALPGIPQVYQSGHGEWWILDTIMSQHFYLTYSIAFVKPAGHREVAPREFDVHSRWKPAREAEEKKRRRSRKEDEDKAVK